MGRFFRWARATFISGLLALLPLGLTLYFLWLLYRLAHSLLGPHTAFAALMRRLIGRYVPGTEVAITLVVVFVVGAVARHWVGRGLLRAVERTVRGIPGVRNVYWGARQLAHAVLGHDPALSAGRRTVLVEFPYPGSYVLGFVTSEAVSPLSSQFSAETVAVYVPTAPNPLSGWVLFVPRTKVFPVDLTAEQALGIILSGGLVVQLPGEPEAPRPDSA